MTVNRPLTLEDAINKAANYAKAEEEFAFIERQHATEKKPPSNTWVRPINVGGNPRKANPHDATLHARKQHAPPNYTFNVDEDINEGGPQAKKWTQDPNAYCSFHKANGHDTVNCETMRKALAEKYAKGELKDVDLGPPPKKKVFNNNNKGRGNPSPKRSRPVEEGEPSSPPTVAKHRVDFIMGGSKFYNRTINSIKAHQRQLNNQTTRIKPEQDVQISFSEKEAVGTTEPHDDALVITIDVSNCEVARVLIDGGSSVDLIFKDTLARMGVSEDEIDREQTQLTGFNGSTTPSLGTIRLPVKMNGINKIVEFQVLDCLSPYNIILGRPWIHPQPFINVFDFPRPEE